MLHRIEDDVVVAISQPAHSWISGQLARAWGNARFAPLSEEVCLAAEQHDIGFLDWERQPTWNSATGLPHHFMEMPAKLHLDLWTTGVHRMARYGRYPALLVSMHFTNIARQGWTENGKDSQLVQAYLNEQESLQTTLKTSLSNDHHYGPELNDEKILADQKLVSVLDWLSLLICLRSRDFKEVPDTPTLQGPLTIAVRQADRDQDCYHVDPWPFRTPQVIVACEGRRLLRKYENESSMREALRAAAPQTVVMRLER